MAAQIANQIKNCIPSKILLQLRWNWRVDELKEKWRWRHSRGNKTSKHGLNSRDGWVKKVLEDFMKQWQLVKFALFISFTFVYWEQMNSVHLNTKMSQNEHSWVHRCTVKECSDVQICTDEQMNSIDNLLPNHFPLFHDVVYFGTTHTFPHYSGLPIIKKYAYKKSLYPIVPDEKNSIWGKTCVYFFRGQVLFFIIYLSDLLACQ